MSETITASLTVSGGDVITAEINTLARGPAGPPGASGASTWDDITGTASDVPFLPVAAPVHSEGLLFYDSTDKSLTYYNDEADVSMNIGREMWVRVRNNSGAQISNGKVVYINDALGQLPTIRLARADSATTSRVIGIATHDIGNNEFGYVTSTGEIKGLNTIAYNDGDALYLSAVTAGEMTTTAPTAPNRTIQVATVLHAHVSQGKLYCHPENDSVASTGIVDSTATGRALITAATQSDARTTGLGSGATGDALFTAASASAARTTLGFDAAVPKIPITFSNNSDFTTASTSFVDVTGLSFPVAANKNYQVVFHLNTNKNDSNGMQYRITGPASPTRVFGRVIVFTSSTSASAADIPTAFNTASTTFNTFNGDSLAFSSPGIIVSNGVNAGTVQLQIRAVTGGTAKIYAGSWIQITEL